MSICQELEQVGNITKKGSNNKQEYYKKLAVAVNNGLGDDDIIWNTLSVKAQTWFNEAVLCIKNSLDIKDFPDEDPRELDKEFEESYVPKDGDIIPLSKLQPSMEVELMNTNGFLWHGMVQEFDGKCITLLTMTGDVEIIKASDLEIIQISKITDAKRKAAGLRPVNKHTGKKKIPFSPFGGAQERLEKITEEEKLPEFEPDQKDFILTEEEFEEVAKLSEEEKEKQVQEAFKKAQEEEKKHNKNIVPIKHAGGRPRKTYVTKTNPWYIMTKIILERPDIPYEEFRRTLLDDYKVKLKETTMRQKYYMILRELLFFITWVKDTGKSLDEWVKTYESAL